jgi:hypothetical protein
MSLKSYISALQNELPCNCENPNPKNENGKIDFDLCACFYVSNFVGFNNLA